MSEHRTRIVQPKSMFVTIWPACSCGWRGKDRHWVLRRLALAEAREHRTDPGDSNAR